MEQLPEEKQPLKEVKKVCWSCLNERKLFVLTEKGRLMDDVKIIDCPKCVKNPHE